MTNTEKQRARTLSYYQWLAERAFSSGEQRHKNELEALTQEIIENGLDNVILNMPLV